MELTGVPYSSAGYRHQAYFSEVCRYPETCYHQGHAEGFPMGYNKLREISKGEMKTTSDPCPSAGYRHQAYFSEVCRYPKTCYHQGHAEGFQMGYNKIREISKGEMEIPSHPYPSAGYRHQAYFPKIHWYPKTGYHQGHAQGLQMGYNKTSPYTSLETGYHQSHAQGLQMGYNKPSLPHTSHQMIADGGHTYQHGYGYKPDVVSNNLPTNTGVGAHNVPGVPGKGQAMEYYLYGIALSPPKPPPTPPPSPLSLSP